MSRLSLCALFLTIATGAAASVLAVDWPQTIVDRGTYMEAIGSVPAAPASLSGCSLRDLGSVEPRYTPAACARISIRLPANMVLTGTQAQVRLGPGDPWTTCTRSKLESAEYRACVARGPGAQTLPDGMVVRPLCFKETRAVCGNLTSIDFEAKNANSSCANMGAELNTVVFGLSNGMKQRPLQYRAVARYKSCNPTGEIESN